MFLLILSLLLRILSNPLANALQKRVCVFESPFLVNFYSSLLMTLILSPVVFQIQIFSFEKEFYFLVLIAGFLCFLGTICLIKALSLGEMSVLGPVNSYKSVIGLIFAFVFLGEAPQLRAFFGFLVIILASFLFLDEKGNFLLNKSVLLRFFALLCTGIEASILKKIIILSNPLTCLYFWALSSLLFSFISLIFVRKIKLNLKSNALNCFIIAALLLLMQFSTNYVFKFLDVGLSLALFQLQSIVSLFIGFHFFHEKGILKKSIGCILMLFGSFLILI